MAEKNPYDKFVEQGPDVEVEEPNPYDQFLPKVPKGGKDRVGEVFTQAGVGLARAARNTLGTPGDIELLGPAKGTRGEAGPRQRATIPAVMPTSKQVGEYFGNLTGKSLPDPAYPEGKYISAITEGGASMLSPNKGAILGGMLSGGLGEAAEQASKGWRLAGNVVGQIPSILSAFIKPWDVKAIAPYVKRIGLDKINLGSVDATDAARVLGTKATDISRQVPQLRPTFEWLQGTTAGGPLANLKAETNAAIRATDLTDTSKWGPHSGENLVNLLMRKPNPDPLPGMPRAVEEGSRATLADWSRAIPWDPGRFLVDRWGKFRAGGRLSDLAHKLASPNAGDYLIGLTRQNTPQDVSMALAQALLSSKIQQDPYAGEEVE
jgi:hypothetical protein